MITKKNFIEIQDFGNVSLFKILKRAYVVPISISNSWKFAKHKYFPIPFGIKILVKTYEPIKVSNLPSNKLIDKVEKIIHSGI